MDRSLRDVATTGASVLVVLFAVLFVSSDAETAVALVAFCVVGYVGVSAYRQSDAGESLRSRVTPRLRRGVGLLVAAWFVLAAADQFDEAIWLASMLGFGYVGYRSGRVLRGALYGSVLGVEGGVALVVTVGAAFLLAGVVGVAGARDVLLKTLFAPHVVGFVTLLWGAVIVAFGGLTGVVAGGVGGALARLY